MIRFRQITFIGYMLFSPFLILGQSNESLEQKGNNGLSDDPTFIRCLQQIPLPQEGDANVIQEQINTCQKLLQKGLQVSAVHQLEFAIRQMKFQQSLGKNETVLKLVLDFRKIANQEGIPTNLKNNYDYICAQTQAFYSDIPNAIEGYSKLLSVAEENLDTTYILHSLFDLGKLYEEQDDFSKAEQYYQQAHNFVKYNNITNDLHIKLLETIVELHLKAEQFNKARPFIQEGLDFSEEQNFEEYVLSFILLKGRLGLQIDDNETGEEVYKEVQNYEVLLENQTLNKKYKIFLAEYYIANRKYDDAIAVYEELMSMEVSLKKTKEWTICAHETSLLKGDYHIAYENLLQSTVLEKHIQHNEDLQQSFYKKQKDATDDSNKADAILAVQFSNGKRQDYFAYGFGLMSLVSLLLFYFLKKEKGNTKKNFEGQLEERTKELQLEIADLKESQKEANAFNKILTHDLRGPLRNIIGFSALARKEITAKSTTSNYLRYVLKGGKQLRQLITDVAVFQEVSDKAPEPMELIDTNNLMKSLVDSMDVLLEESGAELNFPELPSVVSHQPTLFSVFKHLIENGIKYNKSNTPVIEVQYFRNVETHFFQFRDNGIGISSTFHESIFELFKRLNGKSFCEGSGLGLNVSQKLLEKLGGKISVLDSAEGKGSTFQISFPILEEPKTIELDVRNSEKEKVNYEL